MTQYEKTIRIELKSTQKMLEAEKIDVSLLPPLCQSVMRHVETGVAEPYMDYPNMNPILRHNLEIIHCLIHQLFWNRDRLLLKLGDFARYPRIIQLLALMTTRDCYTCREYKTGHFDTRMYDVVDRWFTENYR